MSFFEKNTAPSHLPAKVKNVLRDYKRRVESGEIMLKRPRTTTEKQALGHKIASLESYLLRKRTQKQRSEEEENEILRKGSVLKRLKMDYESMQD